MKNVTSNLLFKYFRGDCNDEEKTLINKWLGKGEKNRKRFHDTGALYEAFLMDAPLELLERMAGVKRCNDTEYLRRKFERVKEAWGHNRERMLAQIKYEGDFDEVIFPSQGGARTNELYRIRTDLQISARRLQAG